MKACIHSKEEEEMKSILGNLKAGRLIDARGLIFLLGSLHWPLAPSFNSNMYNIAGAMWWLSRLQTANVELD
ncbi:hypothetical protein Csa_017236 [Cucumis sativus]|uniref:Uncharacterized protein n=1 Tax=Cucumis sativus TaxID=3659 RepID=A0A0A0K7C7_CUCSA|nr:hypothetical protein Csa_017236 [Cucumis sativus]